MNLIIGFLKGLVHEYKESYDEVNKRYSKGQIISPANRTDYIRLKQNGFEPVGFTDWNDCFKDMSFLVTSDNAFILSDKLNLKKGHQ